MGSFSKVAGAPFGTEPPRRVFGPHPMISSRTSRVLAARRGELSCQRASRWERPGSQLHGDRCTTAITSLHDLTLTHAKYLVQMFCST